MQLYSEVDFPHQPGKHPDWQESWVLVFRDIDTNSVGFLRTGSYVNKGTTQSHWGMALSDGTRFRRHVLDRRAETDDRTERTASSGSVKYSIPNLECVRFEASDNDADADLRLYDYFPSQEWEMIGPLSRSHDGDRTGQTQDAHGHPESAGRLEGRIRIGDRVIEIKNGMGYRDHGYGPRPHQVFRSARWHAGTVGPELSYSLVTMHADDGSFNKMGYLMLDNRRQQIKDLHTVNCSLGDGISSIGGWTHVILQDGRQIRIDAEAIDGLVTSTMLKNGGPNSSPAGVEVLSIARWNGHEGVSDFNMIDNAHRGDKEVSHLFLANWKDGLSKRETNFSWVR